MATIDEIVQQVISTLQEQSRNTEALPQEGNAGSVGSFVALKKADNSMVQVPISVIETMINEKIDEIPTTGSGGTGEIADGAVTERKLSLDVKDKLNTAYDKANLADSLFINDGIEIYKGALRADEDPELNPDNPNFLFSSKILGNGETVVLADGFSFVSYKTFDGDTEFDYVRYVDKKLTLEEGNVYQLGIRRDDGNGVDDVDFSKVIKSFIRNPYTWGKYSNLDNFTPQGRYTISGSREANAQDNMPIYNGGNVEARLEVIENENTLVQILTLLNVGGGDGNIYTRTCQNGSWGSWGKLQTNVEVGVINQQQMDALEDNGIYSGVLETTGETFVLVVINNYSIATQAGYGGYISHLKYSVGLDGVVKVETRRRDAYGFWTDWQGIGGGKPSELLVPSEWQGKLSTLSDGVHEFYGDCSFGKSGTLWGWADSYRYNSGEPTYIKLIKKGQDTALAQAIGTAASATRMINIQTETLL